RTGDGSPRKLSDFLSVQKLHRLGIYNENYRRTGVEYQMTFMVKSLQRESAPTIAIALDRGRRETDFSEHDRFMLNLLRPHVMTAYANAETVGALRRTAPTPGGAPETRRREIIVLRSSGRHLISPRAAYWFGHYFANGAAGADVLPGELEGWVHRQAGRVGRGAALAEPPAPRPPRGRGRRHAAHRAADPRHAERSAHLGGGADQGRLRCAPTPRAHPARSGGAPLGRGGQDQLGDWDDSAHAAADGGQAPRE